MTEHRSAGEVRPRVFVSSVIEGFEEYRAAARRGIKKAEGEPILVNEDFPAMGISSRNACLDAVDSCDMYVGIVGKRGGWTTPSGRLVVEEEYHRAKLRKMPTLMFLQDIERDADAQRLADEISNYVEGTFRVEFRTPVELETAVEQAVKAPIALIRNANVDADILLHALQEPQRFQGQTTLRLILAPERQEEVIDPVTLGSEEFKDRIYEIGHSRRVAIFNYQEQKDDRIEADSLVIQQSTQPGRRDTFEGARLQLAGSGQVIIDSNVTGRLRRGRDYSSMGIYVLAEEDIEAVLRADFHFTAALFDEIDRFKRHQRFFYNVALADIGSRTLERNPQERSSYTLRMAPLNEPIIVYDEPRILGRSDLTDPESEIGRLLALLRRKLEN